MNTVSVVNFIAGKFRYLYFTLHSHGGLILQKRCLFRLISLVKNFFFSNLSETQIKCKLPHQNISI
jgi:hypothetical protein